MVLNHSQGIYYWLPYPALPQSMLFTIGLLTTIGFLFTRFRVRFFDALTGGWAILNNPSVAFGERVIIVGCGEESKLALWLLHRSYFRYAFKIVGMVDENPCLKGMKIEGCTVLGNLKDLPELIKKHHVGLLISTVHVSKLEQVKKMNHSFLRVVALDEILGALYHVLLQPVTTLEYSQWTSSLIGRRIRNG
jgi:FlaA1/EpsC-like NDP-sugar epimerase